MNIGGGEAADQLVRMMLSGSEVAVRLGGSALKNMLALTAASCGCAPPCSQARLYWSSPDGPRSKRPKTEGGPEQHVRARPVREEAHHER